MVGGGVNVVGAFDHSCNLERLIFEVGGICLRIL